MAPHDFREQIEDLQNRIGRLTAELAEAHAKVAKTAVKLESWLLFVRSKAQDTERLAA
jgi:hypothetical protein